MKKIILLSLTSVICFGQKPVFSSDGVVNAATLSSAPVHAIAPASIISIFGTNLATQTASATTAQLPTSLAGTSVTIDGLPAPLFFVSPNQINAQVPQRAAKDGFAPSAPVVVTAGGVASGSVEVPFSTQAPGILTLDANGCGKGAVLNALASSSLNSPDNSARAGGQYLIIFGTGFGVPAQILADGSPAPASPLVHSPGVRGVRLGNRDIGFPTFIGKAPGLVGVDQLNVTLPADSPEGCSVPLEVTGANALRTQPVSISVRRAGGHCVDPPPESVGILRWVKTVSSGIDAPPPAEQLTAQFSAALSKTLPAEGIADIARNACDCALVPRPAPACGGFDAYRDKPLDAGALMAQGPDAGPAQFNPILVSGQPVYSIALAPGTIHEGDYEVSGSGGAAVGAFDSKLHIPTPIQLTTTFPPGTVIDPNRRQGVVVSWTGGDPDSVVRIAVITGNGSRTCECATLASKGTFTFGFQISPGLLGFGPGTDAEMVISTSSEGPQDQRFGAQGLTLGGLHGWTYQWRFGGLKIAQ